MSLQTPQNETLVYLEDGVFFPKDVLYDMVNLYKTAIKKFAHKPRKGKVDAMLPFVRRFVNSEMSLLEAANFHRDHPNPLTWRKVTALKSK